MYRHRHCQCLGWIAAHHVGAGNAKPDTCSSSNPGTWSLLPCMGPVRRRELEWAYMLRSGVRVCGLEPVLLPMLARCARASAIDARIDDAIAYTISDSLARSGRQLLLCCQHRLEWWIWAVREWSEFLRAELRRFESLDFCGRRQRVERRMEWQRTL